MLQGEEFSGEINLCICLLQVEYKDLDTLYNN